MLDMIFLLVIHGTSRVDSFKPLLPHPCAIPLSQICIVFTDGQATDSKQVPAASKAWRAQGIKVFAVGIGNGIDLEGRESME